MRDILQSISEFIQANGFGVFAFVVAAGFAYLILRQIRSEREFQHKLALQKQEADKEAAARVEKAKQRETEIEDRLTALLEKQIEEKRAEIADIRKEANQKMHEMEVASANERGKLHQELDTYRQRLEKMADDLNEIKLLYQAEKRYSATLEGTNQELLETNDSLVQQNQLLLKENAELQQQIADMKRTIETLETRVLHLETSQPMPPDLKAAS